MNEKLLSKPRYFALGSEVMLPDGFITQIKCIGFIIDPASNELVATYGVVEDGADDYASNYQTEFQLKATPNSLYWPDDAFVGVR